jgi:hypothetical protein
VSGSAPSTTFAREIRTVPRSIVCLTIDLAAPPHGAAVARPATPFASVGAARLLDLLGRRGLPATWFMATEAIAAHPELCERAVFAGHEIGLLGVGAAPAGLPSADADLSRGIAAILGLGGQPPRGFRAAGAALDDATLARLDAQRFTYDSSLRSGHLWPWRLPRHGPAAPGAGATGDDATAAGLIEMPIGWPPVLRAGVDGAHPVPASALVLEAPRLALQTLLDEALFMRDSLDWGVLTLALDPAVIGRGAGLRALGDVLDTLIDAGTLFLTGAEAAAEAVDRLGP